MIYLSTLDGLFALRASDGIPLWQGDAASIALDPSGSILYTLSTKGLSA